jgi:gliding motility-associated-like protein
MKKILLSLILMILSESYYSQLAVTPNQTATNLANYLLGGGVTITNAQLTCPTGANAIFTNGATTNLGLNSGVILTTGLASSIPAGNGVFASTNNGAGGIAAMAPLTGTSSNFDGCMLEFDINPHCSPLNIRYKFASEEYPEYVNSGYNDGFGFFISGPNPLGGNYTNLNLATVPGSSTPITIDNVNSSSNSAYYITNSGSTIVYDGMTTVLTGSANVTPCANYHLILAITDGGDGVYDSGVFLQQSGISCVGPTVTATSSASGGGGGVICAGQSATLSASGATTYSWSTGSTSPSITVSPTTTTSYTLGGSNIGVCIQSNIVLTVTVNPSPTAVAGPTKALSCAQTSTVLAGSGGGTYAWSGPGIVSGGTSATPTVNQAGTYSLIVTSSTAPFCPSIVSTVAVTANTTAPTPSASSPSTLTCVTNTVSLSASGGGTYSWSGTGIVSGGSSANPVVNGTGPYVVTVTAANGCTATASTSVPQNITPPTPSASNTATLTCATTTAALTASGGGTYNWSGTGIVSGGSSANPVVNGTGPYVVTVTAANGCTATASTSVPQNITPPTPSASNTATLTCATTTAALTASGGGTYNWSGTGIVSGGSSANPVVNGTGPYIVTVTAANGCTATASTSVPQNITPPTPSASNTATLTCATTTAALTATGGGTYNWSGTGIVSGGSSANPVVNGTGPYVVTVTAANGCTATASTSVAQNTTAPNPSASNSGSLTCSTTSVTLTGTSGGTYVWTGPGIVSGGATANPVVNLTGTYIVTVTAANGCTATANTTVNQNTVTPNVTMPATQTITCASPTVSLIGSASPSSCTPVWTGGACAGATSYTASACSPNTYSLTVTNPLNGCTNTGTVDVVPSIGIPVVTASNSGSITCSTNTAQVTASTTMTPVSYSWSGPGAVLGSSTTNGTVSVGGTYQCVVINTLTGCSSTITTVVPTNTTPVTANVTTPASITCVTTTVSLLATPTGTNYTYNWSGPGTITNGTTDNPTVDAGGNYIVTITDNINGCSGSFTTTVATNTVAPTFTLGSASTVTTTCASPNATLSATSNLDPNTIYTWTTPSSTTLTGTPVFVSTAGVYTVVITNTISGCSSSSSLSQATVEVVADSGIPVVTLSANSVSITCLNPTPTVAITTTASPVSYNWTPTSGIVPGTETTANPSFNAAGSYSAVVTNTISGCATGFASNVVDVILDNSAPIVTLSTATNDGTITCTNTFVTITSTVTSSNNSNLTYTWSPSGVNSTSINDATFTTAGIYTLAVTNTVTGCVTSLTNTANTFTVYADNSAVSATATAISSNTIIGCGAGNSSVTYSSTSTSANPIISWLPGPISSPTLDVTSAGSYSLQVVDAVSGCSVTTTFTVDGSTNIPQNVDAGTNVLIPCGNPSVVLNGATTSTDVVTYDWSGPNVGSISGPSNTQNPTVIDAGVYTLTVTNTISGCVATATVNVSAANVVASFTATPTTGISPLDVNFTDGSTGATAYSWNFGDSNTSTSQNPNHTFTSGTYTVVLTVTSGPCIDTHTVIIVVEDGLTLEIPNVFTPNGDNSNDIFTIKSTGVKDISLQIFNRWGQKLYEFSGPKASWDGKVPSGETAPEGTYFYFVKATGFDDQEIEKHGTVNLFR